MKRIFVASKLMAGMLSLVLATGAWAELQSVSGINGEVFADGDPADVALFPPAGSGAGFPLYYKDTTGLKLTLCVDGEWGGVPCAWEGSPVYTNNTCSEFLYPYQKVVGFGDEGFYFKIQSYPFDVPLNVGGFAQLQYLVETTWHADTRILTDPSNPASPLLPLDQMLAALGVPGLWIDEAGVCQPVDQAFLDEGLDLHRVEPGYELLFSRIRLRLLDTAPAGWYRITHPYGVKTMFRPQEDVEETRRTMERQLVGDLVIDDPLQGWGLNRLQNFLLALNDPYTLIDEANPNPFAHPYVELFNGFTNDGDYTVAEERVQLKSIGPFLYKPDYLTDPTLQIADEHGVVQQYLGVIPSEDFVSPGHPVVGSAFEDPLEPGVPANYFKIRYLAGTADVQPTDEQWAGAPIVGGTSEFNVVGKVFAEPAVEITLDSLGVFRNGEWYLDANGDGIWQVGSDILFSYGSPTDVPLMGDWDGDGIATPGFKRDRTYHLRNSTTAGPADTVFSYGAATDIPLVGDWDGNGTDTIGVSRPAANGKLKFLLRNSNTAGSAEIIFIYGLATDSAVAGDWDGNGTDTIGVYRPTTNGKLRFRLRNSNTAGAADINFNYGLAADSPVFGDWDGNGTDTAGVYRPADGRFLLRNSNTAGGPELLLNFGIPNGKPFAGHR